MAAGAVVVSGAGAEAAAAALPTFVPVAGSVVVCGIALGAAGAGAEAADVRCRFAVAVGGMAAVVLCCRPVVVGGRVLGCPSTGVSGCSDAESVLAAPGVAAVTGSGGEAACVWLVEGLALGRAATVRPPPTRATAVAATARRLFFFQRASCRRRAARPCPVEAVPSWPLDEPAPEASAIASPDAPLPMGAVSV